MRLGIGLAVVLPLLVSQAAAAADYNRSEKTPLYTLALRVPEAAMRIPALRARIMALHETDAKQTRSDAKDDKEADPAFHPYDVETTWRVTFEDAAVISLSGDTYADTGGAHPNEAYQTLVWDKKANRAVAITDLFAPGQSRAALAAIADTAARTWTRIYEQRSGQEAGPEADDASLGIGPDAEKLKTLALTYARGQTRANGIVLLYGAGQVWPHVLGEFRVPVPARVFYRYLSPRWRNEFESPRP